MGTRERGNVGTLLSIEIKQERGDFLSSFAPSSFPFLGSPGHTFPNWIVIPSPNRLSCLASYCNSSTPQPSTPPDSNDDSGYPDDSDRLTGLMNAWCCTVDAGRRSGERQPLDAGRMWMPQQLNTAHATLPVLGPPFRPH